MTENLPSLGASRKVAVTVSRSNSLIGRGLSSIQNGTLALTIADRDALYRKARDDYNRITVDGSSTGCVDWSPDEQVKLKSAFDIFQRLADVGYGKAYFPLSIFHLGEQGLPEDKERARDFTTRAFDWCFANQLQNDPEIWNDLGTLFHLGHGASQRLFQQDNDYRLGDAGNPDYEQAVFWYRQAAEAGFAPAMFNLSGMYEFGYGVEEDSELALSWQTKAASLGHIHAQYGLGVQHEHGCEPVEQDIEQAFYWYLQAAERGHRKALLSVAEMSWDRYGIPDDDELAFDWYIKHAEQGEIWAQWFLAEAYRNGRGIGHDDVKAAYWYRQAAEQGNEKAQWKLGLMYWDMPYQMLEGLPGHGFDLNQARDWLTKAAEEGLPEAQYDLARLLFELGESGEALIWLETASDQGFGPAHLARADGDGYLSEDERESFFEQGLAWYVERVEQGDAERQYEFALMHLRDEVPDASRSAGLYWLRRSAEQGFRQACADLGRNFLLQNGSEETTEEAILWLEHAAELGSSDACKALAELYLLGRTSGLYTKESHPQLIQPNERHAVEWYERGIALGGRAIAFELGCLYLYGKYLSQDACLAEKWLLHAANAGHESAQLLLGKEYASGLRLHRNADLAIHWLEKASEGSISSTLEVGKILIDGDLVPRDFNKAIQWLTHASESCVFRVQAMKIVANVCADRRTSSDEISQAQGWLAAQAALAADTIKDSSDPWVSHNLLSLAEIYELGLGVEPDIQQAIEYYKEAAKYDLIAAIALAEAKDRLYEPAIDWDNP